ncbi:MAG: DUF3604 domain-containing protein [Parvibaculum sp.]
MQKRLLRDTALASTLAGAGFFAVVAGVVVDAATQHAVADETQLLWGDTHLHTSLSFDAYLNRNMSADPDMAYRYAKGLPVLNPGTGARVQIETPLDFLVVADHAVYLGVMRYVVEQGIPTDDLGLQDRVRAWFAQRWLRGVVADDEGMAAFASFLPEPMSVEEAAAQPPRTGGIPAADAMSRTAWQETIAITDRHNEPGTFTSFIGWEWSSIPAGANMHRVVFTPNNAEVGGQFQPFSTADSNYPEDLWAWLDATSKETGAQFVAIPHNSNISKGYMFSETTLRGEPFTAESARIRTEWEPVAEITQFKGDSETHPSLSPEDPFADFETYSHYIQQDAPVYAVHPGDYVREALKTGLKIEARIGVNPFQLGVIGSTDSHTGLASAEEDNFWGKFPRDTTPGGKTAGWRTGPGGGPNGWSMSASGLAAVWAEENTRESIFAAFKRREVYGTTGPRIAVRFFGGWDYEAGAADAADLATIGYAGGVPMGGDLTASVDGEAPKFLVRATKDPKGGNLDRLQIIKGWLDDSGEAQERVYDVAWSGDRVTGADGQLPAVGDTVDITTGEYENTIGAPELSALWQDPDFDASQSAFYYVRVLQIPTPRHSLYDALALGIDPVETAHPLTIQERAYSSAIWYKP